MGRSSCCLWFCDTSQPLSEVQVDLDSSVIPLRPHFQNGLKELIGTAISTSNHRLIQLGIVLDSDSTNPVTGRKPAKKCIRVLGHTPMLYDITLPRDLTDAS